MFETGSVGLEESQIFYSRLNWPIKTEIFPRVSSYGIYISAYLDY